MSSNTGAQNHQFGQRIAGFIRNTPAALPRVSGVHFNPWTTAHPQLPPPAYDPAPVSNMPQSNLRPFPTHRPRSPPAPAQELRPILNARIADLQPPNPPNFPPRGLVFIEPLILAQYGWITANIFRDSTTGDLQTFESLISPSSTRTKQLRLLTITEDTTTSYKKLVAQILQSVTYDATVGPPMNAGRLVRVELYDVQIVWAGERWGTSNDGHWFTSLRDMKRDELKLYFEKMEERE